MSGAYRLAFEMAAATDQKYGTATLGQAKAHQLEVQVLQRCLVNVESYRRIL